MVSFSSRPVGQDIEIGPLHQPESGALTQQESQHNQAFQQHLGENSGNNTRHSLYKPTDLTEIAGNNATLFVHGNAAPLSLGNNASRLEARDNQDAFNVGHNALSSNFTATNNSGRLTTGNNEGSYVSHNNTNMEHIDSNGQDVTLHNSNGSHNIGTNTGYVHVDQLGANGRVHIDHQSGLVHQDFAPGTWMHTLKPNGVDHQSNGNPLTLHAHGQDSVLHNPIGQMLHNPKKTAGEAALTAVTAMGTAAIYANNAAATPASGHSSAGAFHPPHIK